jgi:ribose transport system substrate-binding protein
MAHKAPAPVVPSSGPRYQLATVSRACSVLRAFADEEEALSLAEVSARIGIEKTIVFRLLRTLEQEGLLRRLDSRRYSSNVRLLGRKRYRIGYAAPVPESPFAAAVEGGLRRAAARNQVDLIVVQNNYSARTAGENARELIREGVDLAIEFQLRAKAAALISAMFQAASVPLIAVDIPHPGAMFYGIDNYSVGLSAGRMLARWAKWRWGGEADELVLLEIDAAGSVPHLRLSGAEAVLRKSVRLVRGVQYIDTGGEFLRALAAVRKHLRPARPTRTLVLGMNDPSTLGAIRAFEEAGRVKWCGVVGFGGTSEVRAELRQEGSPLIGCVTFYPERYGEDLIGLALDVLHNRTVPPAVFARHGFLTSRNVDRFYPNDTLAREGLGEFRRGT